MSNIICGHCAKKQLSANPNVFGNVSVQWVSILERQIPYMCYWCGPVYLTAKLIANSPGVSLQVKGIADLVVGGFVVGSGIYGLNELIKWLSKR